MREEEGGREEPEPAADDTEGMSPMARAWVEAGPYLGIGWLFVVSIGVFGGLGWWLDRRLGTGRLLFLLGLLAGMAVGFANFFKVALNLKTRKRR